MTSVEFLRARPPGCAPCVRPKNPLEGLIIECPFLFVKPWVPQRFTGNGAHCLACCHPVVQHRKITHLNMHHHVVSLSSLSLLLSVTTVHVAGSIPTVIVTRTEPVTNMAGSSCTPTCNNSPTASEVEAVDVNLKSTSSASRFSSPPPHPPKPLSVPFLLLGGQRGIHPVTRCAKTTQLGPGIAAGCACAAVLSLDNPPPRRGSDTPTLSLCDNRDFLQCGCV